MTIAHGTDFDLISLSTFPARLAPVRQILLFLLGFNLRGYIVIPVQISDKNENKPCMTGKTGQKPAGRGTGQAQRLLDGLYRQRGELGDIAHDLISRLKAAGIKPPGHDLRNPNLRTRTK